MPASNQAVPMPTPVPSSRISPAGLEATSVRNNDPVSRLEDMVKPRVAAACASSFTTAGGLRLVVSSILVAPLRGPQRREFIRFILDDLSMQVGAVQQNGSCQEQRGNVSPRVRQSPFHHRLLFYSIDVANKEHGYDKNPSRYRHWR